jgi:hypothetical protein
VREAGAVCATAPVTQRRRRDAYTPRTDSRYAGQPPCRSAHLRTARYAPGICQVHRDRFAGVRTGARSAPPTLITFESTFETSEAPRKVFVAVTLEPRSHHLRKWRGKLPGDLPLHSLQRKEPVPHRIWI